MAAGNRLVTIYALRDFGYSKKEGKLIEYGERPHAQYDRFPYVIFISKGKRKQETIGPEFVLLDGHGFPDSPDAFTHEHDPATGRNTWDRSKYPCFDPRYAIELNEVINPFSDAFIADYRRNKTTILTEEDMRIVERNDAVTHDSLAIRKGYEQPSELVDSALLSDDRTRAIASLVQRLGQSDFRRRLIDAYDSRCAVTGCNIEAALQAAHVVPYLGTHSNATDNGILLRADIHNLFDLHLLSVEPDTLCVCLAPELCDSSYAELQGLILAVPEIQSQRPNRAALKRHHDLFRSRCLVAEEKS